MKRLNFLLAFCVLSASAFAHKGATGIVKERMDEFKASQQAIKQIFAATKSADLDAVVPLAEQIKTWAEMMPDYFPPEVMTARLRRLRPSGQILTASGRRPAVMLRRPLV